VPLLLLLHAFQVSWPSPGSAEAAAPGVIRDHLLLCVAAAEWFSWFLQLLPSLPQPALTVPSSSISSRGSTKEAGAGYNGDAMGIYVHPLQMERVVVVVEALCSKVVLWGQAEQYTCCCGCD